MSKVTVIIPVYNVEEYLDQCLESVVGQTFSDIEIIVINDGSTDSSGEKCQEWARRDSRIIYVSKENEGQGPARNLGIKMASCEYVAFLDSDDWWDERYIEAMYSDAQKKNSDIVVCGYHEYDNENDQLVLTACPDITDEKSAFYSRQSVWGKLYKKSIFLENDITMPNFPGQDAAISGFMITKAAKIGTIPLPLYYYRTNRINSAMRNYERHIQYTVAFLSYHCDLFKRDEIFDKYRDWLLVYSLMHIHGWRRTLRSKGVDPGQWHEKNVRFLNEYFPGWDKLHDLRLSCIGSYSLYSSIRNYAFFDDKKISPYGFSSVISIMSRGKNRRPPAGSNPMRSKALESDFNKTLIENSKNEGRDDFIIIDFLDERSDILKLGDDEYYTYSPALIESGVRLDGKILRRWDSGTMLLWREKCLEFIGWLSKRFSPERIILVKNRLAEYYGVSGRENLFDNIDEIRLVNSKLDECYAFFEENLPGISVVDSNGFADCYTYEHFHRGCKPWNFNVGYNIRIADAIVEHIRGDLFMKTDKNRFNP